MLSPQTVTINSDTTRESLTASPSFLNSQQGILIYCLLTNITATYSTVPIITEYLWWQWIALCGLPILRNIFIHPLSFLLWHCDIHFFKLYAIGFQKPHHILLPLLYLDERKKKKKKNPKTQSKSTITQTCLQTWEHDSSLVPLSWDGKSQTQEDFSFKFIKVKHCCFFTSWQRLYFFTSFLEGWLFS